MGVTLASDGSFYGTTNRGGALGLPARDQFSADDNSPFGKSEFLADLHHPVPARALDGWADELGADVAFAKIFPVD